MVKAKSLRDNKWVTGVHWVGKNLLSYVIDEEGNKILVRENTICHCLDIKDRNNITIYEGDIVRISQRSKKLGVLEYDKELLRWYFDCNLPENSEANRKYRPTLCASNSHLYEVIGNKWNNHGD